MVYGLHEVSFHWTLCIVRSRLQDGKSLKKGDRSREIELCTVEEITGRMGIVQVGKFRLRLLDALKINLMSCLTILTDRLCDMIWYDIRNDMV